MSRMTPRRALHIDASQPAIVRALRAVPGCVVDVIGYPVDLLVSFRGHWLLFDCKSILSRDGEKDGYRRKPRLTKRTRDQEEFVKRHNAVVHFPSSPAEALGVLERYHDRRVELSSALAENASLRALVTARETGT